MTSRKRPYRSTPFQKSLQKHLVTWSKSTRRPLTLKWVNWRDGVYPAYLRLMETLVLDESVKLDDQIHHPRSSQVFAFNLFLPFREKPTLLSDHISELVGDRLTIDKVRFEWVPPPTLLVESGNYATAVDVVLWGRLENGDHAVVLVEVKLSEEKFSHCKGRTSPRNNREDVCESAKLFFDDPSACYLIRSAGAEWSGRYRRYWKIFAKSHGSVRDAFPNADFEGPCPFAYDMNQPMRNLAIARGLEQEGAVEKAWFALCAHDNNPHQEDDNETSDIGVNRDSADSRVSF